MLFLWARVMRASVSQDSDMGGSLVLRCVQEALDAFRRMGLYPATSKESFPPPNRQEASNSAHKHAMIQGSLKVLASRKAHRETCSVPGSVKKL